MKVRTCLIVGNDRAAVEPSVEGMAEWSDRQRGATGVGEGGGTKCSGRRNASEQAQVGCFSTSDNRN
jgi:hypothetical protein